MATSQIATTRRARSDEALEGVLGGERAGQVGDELIHGDTPTEGLGLKPGLGIGRKIERHSHAPILGQQRWHRTLQSVYAEVC